MEIIQEKYGRNNSVSFIKKHLSLPYSFKTNIQMCVRLEEHEFYKRQSTDISKRVILHTRVVQLSSLQLFALGGVMSGLISFKPSYLIKYCAFIHS